ncbi:glycosyltransferase family 4 protein [Marinobacter sp. F3R08]|uniref:glycosyltransferase family 4 protein n=1 Tax=Marinobacter sp. F3R08 TaxID=2841559 RepID=UPI001C087A67|nr:glycosyltransferase family 1 protein [Marinobacter sp. F3R08]MBU2954456.1 glycosyltransferase family 4 protein [Marinobacter sp. F3R08]
MRVVLRLDSLDHPRTGIGYYTEHLCRELGRLPGVDVKGVLRGQLIEGGALEQLLDEEGGQAGGSGSASGLLNRWKPFLRSVPGAYPLRQWVRDQRASRAVSGLGECLYHEPNFVPFRFSGPLIVTVHDLSHLRYPEYHPAGRVRFLNKQLPGALDRADLVITDSEFIQSEICSFFPDVARKVVPVHLGVEEDLRQLEASEAQQVLSRFGLDYKGYILSVATLEPRKNLVGLVEAYDRLPERFKNDYPLVLVGGSGWDSDRLYRIVESVGQRGGKVILAGRVPRADLAGLISGARLFAYPSFYEGFGLPIAEARACGTPVLTSDFGAMAEVAGKQAFLADLGNLSGSLEEALATMPDRLPPYRFSWKTTAEKTLSAYQSV